MIVGSNLRQIYNIILTIVDGRVFFLCFVAVMRRFFDKFAAKYIARNETFITDSLSGLDAGCELWREEIAP